MSCAPDPQLRCLQRQCHPPLCQLAEALEVRRLTAELAEVFRADIFGPTSPLVGVADLVEGALFRFRIAGLPAEAPRAHGTQIQQFALDPSDRFFQLA